MPRPKGSKNKSNIETQNEIERLQKRINEIEEYSNSYSDTLNTFVEGFVMELYNQDVIKKISTSTLQNWFSNPDQYMQQITNLLTYYYIVDGNIFQLYDLIFTLPQLDYSVTVLEKDEQSQKDLQVIKYFLEKKIRHKELTRDLAVQLASKGTILGTWLGSSKDPYFYTFDNLEYIYPYGRYKGKMVGVVDLRWLDDKSEKERQVIYGNLSPMITERKYKRYKEESDSEKKEELRYVTLPVEKSLVERIHTLSRNQRLGIPFGTQALFDMQHKQVLKNLEVAIANKIIRAIAVLKMRGKDDNDVKVSADDKKKVFAGVKKALEKNSKDDGITCIAIPDFASFEFSKIEGGDKILNPDKYDSVNNDISASTGVSPVLSNGTGSNYSAASLNLSIMYKKIGILLEKIELIYNQLINIILGERGENYIFSYSKTEPLQPKDKLDALFKLQSQGFSTKAVLDSLGIESDEYFKQSIFEIENLKLREKIVPPLSTYTITENEGGRPSGDGKTENDDGNMQKSPSDN